MDRLLRSPNLIERYKTLKYQTFSSALWFAQNLNMKGSFLCNKKIAQLKINY